MKLLRTDLRSMNTLVYQYFGGQLTPYVCVMLLNTHVCPGGLTLSSCTGNEHDSGKSRRKESKLQPTDSKSLQLYLLPECQQKFSPWIRNPPGRLPASSLLKSKEWNNLVSTVSFGDVLLDYVVQKVQTHERSPGWGKLNSNHIYLIEFTFPVQITYVSVVYYIIKHLVLWILFYFYLFIYLILGSDSDVVSVPVP